MKSLKFLTILFISVSLFACVGKKKYTKLNESYERSLQDSKTCQDQLKNLQTENSELNSKNKMLADQVEYMKKNGDQTISALQDLSVLSSKQAESMKESLKNLSQKDAYIQDLQTAMRHKDSLNMALVMNLKSGISGDDQDINIKVDKGVVFIDLSDKLLFNTGKYNVTAKAKTVLGKIATVLNTHPELDVMVEGHTDSVAISNAVLADNWDLSVKRATSVVRILQKDYKIDPARLTAAGHGKYMPVASNATADGRSLNRRTRIIILPQLDQFFKLLVKDGSPN